MAEAIPEAGLAIWYAFFLLSSVGMQLLNKMIAVSFRATGVYSLDNLVMIWQQIAAVGLNFVGIAAIGGEVWAINPITRAQVKRLVFPSTSFVLMLGSSLKALKTVHVASVVVARNLCTVVVCAGEWKCFGRATPFRAVVSLLVIVAGAVVYGYWDLSFEPVGYFWLAANSMLFCLNQLYEKWAMGASKDQTALGVSTIKNSLSIPVLLALALYNRDFELEGVDRVPLQTWVLIMLTGVGCCTLSITYMMLYKLSTATAIAVGGNVNKAVSIVLASYIFETPLGNVQTVGLWICLLGSLWYSIETIRAKTKVA